MRKLAAVALIAIALMQTGCTMWPEHKSQNWSQATRAESLNRLFWEDVASKRWNEVAKHVAPLAVFQDGTKSYTGSSAIVERIKSLGISSAQVGEVESQPAGADLVTTYSLTIGTGAPVRAMAVWQQAGEHWVVVAVSIPAPRS